MITRFKVEYLDLIDKAFKKTIKIARDNDLINSSSELGRNQNQSKNIN